MYKGNLLIEDLTDLSVMNYLEIEKTGSFRCETGSQTGNRIAFSSRYIDFPFILSGCLKSFSFNGKPCFVEMDDTGTHFIVMKGSVFSYNKGNRQEKEQILRKCEEMGIILKVTDEQ